MTRGDAPPDPVPPAARLPFLLLGMLALVGGLLWLAGAPVSAAAPWWLGFLVLTIAGERLELSRFVPTPQPARQLFFPGLRALGGAGHALAIAVFVLTLLGSVVGGRRARRRVRGRRDRRSARRGPACRRASWGH